MGGQPSDAATPSPLLFVDLETTGLAGGAGTYAFLVGCAFFEPHGFRIRQYFLGAFQHERTLLNEVDGLVRRSAGLVSYNGKSFDVPVLETRYHFNRLAPPFEGFAHVDMLHVARRFWRSAPAAPGAWPDTDSCRLSALERVAVRRAARRRRAGLRDPESLLRLRAQRQRRAPRAGVRAQPARPAVAGR